MALTPEAEGKWLEHKGRHYDCDLARAVAAERERCARIAEAIDSGRGNEKEIARAIRAQSV